MKRWAGVWALMGVALLLLSGCVVRPGGYGYVTTGVAVAGPQVAFTFSDGVDAYYEPAFGAYIYSDDGYYYRWVNDGWVYATYYDGPWIPVVATVYLPPLLAFGPPPPIVRYRPYFVWWRMHAARWYAIHHPHWWYRHHLYMRHYAQWRAHVVRYYENHPGRRPAMRVLFHRREQRLDRLRHQRAMARRRQERFHARHPLAGPRPPAFRGPASRRPLTGRPPPGYRGPASRRPLAGRRPLVRGRPHPAHPVRRRGRPGRGDRRP